MRNKNTAFDSDSTATPIVGRHSPRERHIKTIEQTLHQLGQKHSLHRVFRDWLEMAALAMSNAVDLRQRETREARYLEIVKGYSADEIEAFPRMYGELVNALECGFDDVLGRLYGTLEIGNVKAGQYFTPYTVCLMMAKMQLFDAKGELDTQPFHSVYEPCIGAGAMIIAAAQAFREENLNPQTQMHVTGVDIDLTCVLMSYLQLSLLGIPAAIYHGDTLKDEYWAAWYTPFHIFYGWDTKLRRREQQQVIETEIAPVTTAEEPLPETPDLAASPPTPQMTLFPDLSPAIRTALRRAKPVQEKGPLYVQTSLFGK